MKEKTMGNGRQLLSEDDLDWVNGGFMEDRGYVHNKEVTCPYCGESRKSKFRMIQLDNLGVNEYRCLSCNGSFQVGKNGSVN